MTKDSRYARLSFSSIMYNSSELPVKIHDDIFQHAKRKSWGMAVQENNKVLVS